MKSKFMGIFVMLIVISMLVGCTRATPAPTQAPQPTQATAPTEAVAPTQPPAAEEPAPVGVEDFQADPTNLFPNGIGEVNCQGVNLVAATQTGPQIASPMENHWKEWGDKTGGTVEVQTFPFGDLFEKIRAGYVSGASPFDIIVYASDWAGDLAGAGYLLEVPQKNQDQMGYEYLIPTYRDRILTWGGKVYGTPYDGDSHITYLRKDLLTNPEYMAEFKTQYGYDIPVPIQTWTQYHDIAEYFNGKEIDGETIYGAGTAFKRKAQSYWTFLGIAAPFSKSPDDPAYFFDPDTMEPRINNPGFVEALDFYTSLVAVGPPDVVNWDVGDIRNNFPAGKLALGIDWGDVGPLSADPNSSIVTDKWSAQLHPGVDRYYDVKSGQWVEQYNQAPFLAFGGWIGGVSTTTKNAECAFDFLSFMGNYNMSALNNVTPGTGVNPHFYSDVNNLDPWIQSGMSESQATEYLAAVRDTIKSPNSVVDLRITGAPEYFDALDTQLARAIVGEVSSQEALDQVAKDWNAITDRLGRDQQKTLYRQMLGLPEGEAAAPAEEPAPVGVEDFQADPTNLFPNGIGEVNCQGVNLVAATQTGPQIASPMENHWKEWGDKTGGTVEVQTFPFGDLFEKIRAGYVSGASPFDIIVYASDWAGDLAGAGYLLEVPQKNQDQMGYEYLIPTYRDRILTWGGKVYGTPYDGDSHITYLRKDLLTNPEYMAEFKTQYGYDIPVPIQTWTQYHDIAEYFNGKEIDGETIYGAGTAFKRKAQSYWTFLGIAAPFSKSPDDPAYFFDPDTMEPRINNPGFVEALDFYTSLVAVGPPDVVNWDVGDIRNNFPAGKLALGIDWGDVGPLSADPNSSIVTDKWSAQLHPGVDRYYDVKSGQWVEQYNQAPFLAFGGWIGGVSTTTKNAECAFDFLSFMGNYNMSALNNVTPGTGVNPHFYSDVNNLDPWIQSGMSESQATEYLAAVRDTIKSPNSVVDLRITGAPEYFDALDTQLARAIAGEVSSQEALDQVAKDWNAITDRLGRDQQKMLYRQMLGLPVE